MEWYIGEAEGRQLLSLPMERDQESYLWRASWRPDGSHWLTHEDLVIDIKELLLGVGCVVVWPEADGDSCIPTQRGVTRSTGVRSTESP